MSFYALQLSFEQTYHAFAKKPDKLFWATLKEKIFAIVGKGLEHLESKEIYCAHRPNFLSVSAGTGEKKIEGLDPVLVHYGNRSSVRGANQLTNDQREQTLHLDTTQLVLNQDPTVS